MSIRLPVKNATLNISSQSVRPVVERVPYILSEASNVPSGCKLYVILATGVLRTMDKLTRSESTRNQHPRYYV